MSLANKNTFFASGSGAATYHIGQGKVYGFIASTTNAAAQTFVLYDSALTTGSVLLSFTVPADDYAVVFFPEDKPVVFNEGLTIDPTNCDVLLFLST